MTETEFPWGSVTRETDPVTGKTRVDVFVDAKDEVSVSTRVVSDVTDEVDRTDTARSAEIETFPWGAVIHAADSGVTDIEVLIDAEDGGTRSTSVSVVQTTGGSSNSVSVTESTSTSVTRSTTDSSSSINSASVSQSTTSSTGDWSEATSIPIDDGDDDDGDEGD